MSLLHLFKFTSVTFLSSVETADKCRKELETLLIYNNKVEIDFSNVYVTAGFLNRFFDKLIEKRTELIFDRLFFANCSEATESNLMQIFKTYRRKPLYHDQAEFSH